MQPVSAGGSNAGRQTVRILQSLLDHYAMIPPPVDSAGMLTDAVSSQRTPIRFTSLLTIFRLLVTGLTLLCSLSVILLLCRII